MRAMITPAIVSAEALAALKQWLGITTAVDDAPLLALLRMGLEACENFTGTTPLACVYEETVPITAAWQLLKTRPVRGIAVVSSVLADGTRAVLPATDYASAVDADGGGMVRIHNPGAAEHCVVRFEAGLAADWVGLPEAMRQGVIRLAAHQHRMREGDAAGPIPPAAVAALWRPWRRLRLA